MERHFCLVGVDVGVRNGCTSGGIGFDGVDVGSGSGSNSGGISFGGQPQAYC